MNKELRRTLLVLALVLFLFGLGLWFAGVGRPWPSVFIGISSLIHITVGLEGMRR